MRTLLLVAVALSSFACDPNWRCLSLTLGQPTTGLPLISYTSASAFFTPPVAGFPRLSSGLEFDVGPVSKHQCCFTQARGEALSWCDPGYLQCEDPAFQGVELFALSSPYHLDYGTDAAQTCAIAVKDGLIVAFWSRHWS